MKPEMNWTESLLGSFQEDPFVSDLDYSIFSEYKESE